MKKYLRLLIALALLAPAPAATTADAAKKKTRRSSSTRSTSSKYDKYSGTVGKYKVTMFLDNNYNGYYYYGNGSKGKLTIKGYPTGEMCGAACIALILKEYDSKGKVTATWDVYISGMTVSPGYRVWGMTGEMTTSAGRTYDVNLDLIK